MENGKPIGTQRSQIFVPYLRWLQKKIRRNLVKAAASRNNKVRAVRATQFLTSLRRTEKEMPLTVQADILEPKKTSCRLGWASKDGRKESI